MKKFSKIEESKVSKFSMGIDIHGVIDSLPDTFSFLSDAIIKNGGDVHIITGGSWTKELEDNIKSLGIKYTHKFSVYDFLIETQSDQIGEIVFADGTIQRKFQDGCWDKAKGEYCIKHNISLHIDDTLVYNEFFKTPFCRLWTNNNKPKASHKSLRHLD